MKAIYKKLFEVKKEGLTLLRDTKAYNYKYATLDQIQEKLNPILEKQGLLVLHNMSDGVLNTSIIDIETGELTTSSIELTTTKPQDKGSEITYFRRYNLLCLLDLTVEDDDGKKAQDSKPKSDEKPRFGEAKYNALVAKKDIYKDFGEALTAISKIYQMSLEMEIKIKKLYSPMKEK